jgi:malonyl-CoA O-methyltransferase
VLAGTHWGTILELGCGTGKNTSFLAQIGDQVQAVDFSPGMLAQARAKVDAPNVTFAAADITQPWPCADASVDLIVINLVLEHIADLDFIFAEASRCLRPGGRLFNCELHPYRQYEGTQANFTLGDEQVLIPAYLHHLSDFLAAAGRHGFALAQFDEWWRQPDRIRPPLLVSFLLAR